MQVREFVVMIPMKVQLYEKILMKVQPSEGFLFEDGRFDIREINEPCYICELSEELQKREVKFFYPKSVGIMGIVLNDVEEPELPFSEEVPE